jgi:hypothetical protein
VVIPHPKYSEESYITAMSEKYINYEPMYFDYEENEKEVNLIMGRSMLTLAYRSIKDYDKDTVSTLRLLFKFSISIKNVKLKTPYGSICIQIEHVYS